MFFGRQPARMTMLALPDFDDHRYTKRALSGSEMSSWFLCPSSARPPPPRSHTFCSSPHHAATGNDVPNPALLSPSVRQAAGIRRGKTHWDARALWIPLMRASWLRCLKSGGADGTCTHAGCSTSELRVTMGRNLTGSGLSVACRPFCEVWYRCRSASTASHAQAADGRSAV